MGESAAMADDLRQRIIRQPDVILEDIDVMRALVAANDKAFGDNVVDLRGIAMERLESRLDRLEETHRSVIAAAYENLAGTNLVHRAVLRLIEAQDLAALLADLDGPLADILKVARLRLVLETAGAPDAADAALGPALHVAGAGFVARYLDQGPNPPQRKVLLRQCDGGPTAIYGAAGAHIRSEALLRLDLGTGRLPGMLVLGSEDPHQYSPGHGTDLLTFLGAVFEAQMRRCLA
ncbi:DUF484 family protein [Rhodobacteraceae bacterium CCMM004]|nr:DUF484 family protein [Rhodobacteraceae bacterium CCMM004]